MSQRPLDDLSFILPQQHLRQAVAKQEETLLWSAERRPKPLPYALLFFVTVWTMGIVLFVFFVLTSGIFFALGLIAVLLVGFTLTMIYLTYRQVRNELNNRGIYYGLTRSTFWMVSQHELLAIPLDDLSDWVLVQGKQVLFCYDKEALQTHPLLKAHHSERNTYQLLGLSGDAKDNLYQQLNALHRFVAISYE